MIFRAAFSEDVLAELGLLTISFAGLEDQLAGMIAALEDLDSQAAGREVAARMMFSKKLQKLERLCSERYARTSPALLPAMTAALVICRAAGDARNDLVHGVVDYEHGMTTVSRPGKPKKAITLEGVQSLNRLVHEGFTQTINAFGNLWNSNMGHFDLTPEEYAARKTSEAST